MPSTATRPSLLLTLIGLTATDRAGNQTTQPFHVMEDTSAPTVTIRVPPVAPLRFWVSWLGQDTASGLRDYAVQYKVGAGGTWTSWLTHTPQTEAPFVGEAGQSYFFQVRATDNVNNTSAWVEAGPVTVSAVTKYYYHGAQRVAMRQGDVVYPGLPGGSQDRLHPRRSSRIDLFNNRHNWHSGSRDALPALRRGALDQRRRGE